MERYIFIRRMFYFLELCEKRKTGSKKQLVETLNMSESSVKRMISDLRDAGIQLGYDHNSQTYFKENE